MKGGAIPPAMPGHSHKVAPSYDPELARKLLADAGYPEGKGLPEVSIVASIWNRLRRRARRPVARGARRATSRCGLIEGHLWGSNIEDTDHMWLSGWTADYPDPDGFFRGLFKASGWPLYMDAEIEEIYERARDLKNTNERMRLYHELDRIWVSERAAILPMFYGRTMLVRRPWIEDLWTTPLTRLQLDQVVVGPH